MIFELYSLHRYGHAQPVEDCPFCFPPEPGEPDPPWELLYSVTFTDDKVKRRRRVNRGSKRVPRQETPTTARACDHGSPLDPSGLN